MLSPADDHMVQNGNIENLPGFDQLAGDADILRAWGRIARRMIVRDGNGGGSVLNGSSKNFPWMNQGGIRDAEGCQRRNEIRQNPPV